MTSHVLITVTVDGAVDFCSLGDINIVLVDYRDTHTSVFPDEVDALTKQVKACPTALPWRAETILALKAISREKRSALLARLPMYDEALQHAHPLPNAG